MTRSMMVGWLRLLQFFFKMKQHLEKRLHWILGRHRAWTSSRHDFGKQLTRKKKTLTSCILWSTHCTILINFCDKERWHILNNVKTYSLITCSFWGYTWKLRHKMSSFPIWPVQYLACQKGPGMCKVTWFIWFSHVPQIYQSKTQHPKWNGILVMQAC